MSLDSDYKLHNLFRNWNGLFVLFDFTALYFTNTRGLYQKVFA